jgi:hypothetical protein
MREGEALLMDVQDTGPGIAAEDLGSFSSPSARPTARFAADTAARLRLSITKRFIEL